MTEFVLQPAVVEVAEAEYLRLLCYPHDAAPSERAADRGVLESVHEVAG